MQGISCQGADKFIEALYQSKTTVTSKYKCVNGKFKAPPGQVPELCTHAGVKIEFAGKGG